MRRLLRGKKRGKRVNKTEEEKALCFSFFFFLFFFSPLSLSLSLSQPRSTSSAKESSKSENQRGGSQRYGTLDNLLRDEKESGVAKPFFCRPLSVYFCFFPLRGRR